ncbi:hypothetical protein [Planctomicrobium piriforme]|uniref:Uncharacterized protein n=1 Tax=Planctomicrobium piriforme TaxID=1576369 RepID=A0A1I3CDM2_9PLAN|nr:hypothetical protein [Planctomicrobium piriforme]SFH72339.1 hypothetical protein SAMN05421753_102227 [Planctomicrobium piriforme]
MGKLQTFASRLLFPALMISVLGSAAGAAPAPGRATAQPETGKAPPADASDVYAPPSAAELKAAVLDWVEQRHLLETPLVDAIAPSWQFEEKPTPERLFETLMRTFYLADAETRQLVDGCRQWSYSPTLLQVKLPGADRDRYEPLFTNNVRYFLARHFTLLTAYNDALSIFQQIDVKYVVDPAGCLFHRAVCEQHLLMKEQGLKTLQALQNQTEGVPVRYRKLAELMQSDLEKLEEKSLGEVARQMKDVERRLSLQQTDAGVQKVEEKIIATLDELIQKLEEQQQQQNSSSGGAQSAGQAPTNPASESYVGGVKGPGETDKKDIGHKDHWGDLPPKAREAAKNMLETEFPAHYRQAVEEYLKKLADRPAPPR